MRRPIPLFLVLLTLVLAVAPRAEASPRAPAAAMGHRAQGPRKPDGKAEAKKEKAEAKKEKPAAKAPIVPARSVGHPNDGKLVGGVRLDTSRKEIRVVPAYARDDVRWGLPALVRMIERAAKGVAKRSPGAVLDVGDLSRKTGGEVHRHNSHESGRDADIGFYAVDAKGKQVHARTFIRFDERLASTTVSGARFDVGRNWLLVQEMLTDPGAHVSHIFVAAPLRDALLAEAKRRGVSRALLTKAQLTMMQPTFVEAHDDHMHVRISCPRASGGQCVELAKNAPTARDRVRAARLAHRGKGALRTPARAGTHDTGSAAKPGSGGHAAKRGSGDQALKRGGAARARGTGAEPRREAARRSEARQPARPPAAPARAPEPVEAGDDVPAAVHGTAQAPMKIDEIDLAILRAPALSLDEVEAEADGAEVRDAIDDSGAVKITE
ncbi:MAG: penicillin-insensitive murein endopeptidase [Polyangiaceae bacterium]|nr:penicillin-insensitive murein endopeptidase [Polyangiaceae bacterium]